jgi:hypothetical protein
MVTHSSTSRPVQCLYMAERTEYTVVTRLTPGNRAEFARAATTDARESAVRFWPEIQEFVPEFVNHVILWGNRARKR